MTGLRTSRTKPIFLRLPKSHGQPAPEFPALRMNTFDNAYGLLAAAHARRQSGDENQARQLTKRAMSVMRGELANALPPDYSSWVRRVQLREVAEPPKFLGGAIPSARKPAVGFNTYDCQSAERLGVAIVEAAITARQAADWRKLKLPRDDNLLELDHRLRQLETRAPFSRNLYGTGFGPAASLTKLDEAYRFLGAAHRNGGLARLPAAIRDGLVRRVETQTPGVCAEAAAAHLTDWAAYQRLCTGPVDWRNYDPKVF